MKMSELQRLKKLAGFMVEVYDEAETTKRYDAILKNLEQTIQQAIRDVVALGVSEDRAQDIVWDQLEKSANLPIQPKDM
jgi:CobQ-like glutamine amidotransferase family enzyme